MKHTARTHAAPRIPYPQTPASAHQWLIGHGITVTDFARRHGLNRLTVVDVLHARSKGNFGAAHRAAVALGIKRPVDTGMEDAA